MKRITLAILLAVLALGIFAGSAAAQGSNPPREGTGLLHDYFVAALADRLDMTVEAVEASLAAGDTLYDIALDAGIAETEIPALLLEVRQAALQAAVADGVLTQAQADWMSTRMGRRGQGSTQSFGCPMGGSGGGWMGHGFRGQPVNP
jgi:hypothetical protein